MQQRGVVGMGVDAKWHRRTERQLLVWVALPLHQSRATDALARTARRRKDKNDGNGVTGDNNDMAMSDNGSRCACLFGSLCPCVEVGPLTLWLAQRARRWRWQRRGSGTRFAHLAWGRAADASACAAQRRNDDNNGNGVTGDNDNIVTGNDGLRCATACRRLVRAPHAQLWWGHPISMGPETILAGIVKGHRSSRGCRRGIDDDRGRQGHCRLHRRSFGGVDHKGVSGWT